MKKREAVGGILLSEGKILLVYKVAASDGTPITPFWGFPVGGTDGQEHYAALIREIREETGIEITPPFQKAAEMTYQYEHKGQQIEQHVTLYLTHIQGTPTITPEDEEITEGRWLTPQDAYELITHDIGKNVIKELFL